MWRFLSDLNSSVIGTHFYYDDFHWQMYDQVIVKPSLLPNMNWEALSILTTDGKTNFLNQNGKINNIITSDHLPIKVVLNF